MGWNSENSDVAWWTEWGFSVFFWKRTKSCFFYKKKNRFFLKQKKPGGLAFFWKKPGFFSTLTESHNFTAVACSDRKMSQVCKSTIVSSSAEDEIEFRWLVKCLYVVNCQSFATVDRSCSIHLCYTVLLQHLTQHTWRIPRGSFYWISTNIFASLQRMVLHCYNLYIPIQLS